MKKLIISILLLCTLSLQAFAQTDERVITGDEQTSEYFPLLEGKRIAIFSNHTGMIGNKHLLDVLLETNSTL